MGRPTRYSTTVTSGSYNKGNVAIGTNPINYDQLQLQVGTIV